QNTLNASTIFMNASAKIIPGQATGGRAELYVGSVLVAFDNSISATDDYVTFTTSENAPTNAKLQAAVPVGGVVTVKLYSADGKTATSAVGNPNLTVDYIAPTLTGITSAIYDRKNNLVYLNVTGAGAVGDVFDVTKLVFYDASTNRSYQLSNASGSGSKGAVNNPYTVTVNLGITDRFGLYGFGETAVYLNVSGGALLKDAAGNEAIYYPTTAQIPVTVIK
ncbi:MAG: S-layer protein, partial [Herbinix sp.]|nr:S-layer protein [Herbinix sp.]